MGGLCPHSQASQLCQDVQSCQAKENQYFSWLQKKCIECPPVVTTTCSTPPPGHKVNCTDGVYSDKACNCISYEAFSYCYKQ